MQQSLLCRFWVRGQGPEIMFGVLVVVLCPDPVADLGLGTGERQIPLIVFFARLIYSNSPRTFLVLAQTGDCQLEKVDRGQAKKSPPPRLPGAESLDTFDRGGKGGPSPPSVEPPCWQFRIISVCP